MIEISKKSTPILLLGALFVLGALASGCSSSDDGDDPLNPPVVDTTAPPNVLSFQVIPGDGHVLVSWAFPQNPDHDTNGIMLRRATDAAPTMETGAVVYEGAALSFTDNTINNDTLYFYSAFTYDHSGNYSTGSSDSCTPRVGAPIVFADENLEIFIRAELGIPSEDITDLNMLTLVELNARAEEIADLQGIQYCLNLEILLLGNNQLGNDSNVQLIALLTKLRQLDLGQNELTIIPNFSALIMLEDFDLVGTAITSLGPLSAVTSLMDLAIGVCPVSDLSPLESLTNLVELTLIQTDITSLSSLENLVNLESLQITNNSISDLSPLSNLANLTSLTIQSTDISDLSPLSGMSQLATLSISTCDVEDLGPLANLTSLSSLGVSNCQITDVSPLAGLSNLGYLSLESNPIRDISALSTLTGLVSFTARNCRISDIGILGGCPGLVDAYLHNNPLNTEMVLTNIPALEAAGASVAYSYESELVQLMGLWSIGSITQDGVSVDPSEFFEWDPSTVGSTLTVYPFGAYISEDVDASGAPTYIEDGVFVVDGSNVSVVVHTENGVDVNPPYEAFSGTWAKAGTDMVFTTVVEETTIVMTWIR